MRQALAVALAAASTLACGYSNEYVDRGHGFGGPPAAGVKVADVPVRGVHVVVVVSDDGADAEGELLAVSDQHVFVLTHAERREVAATEWTRIKEIRVTVAGARPGEPAGTIVWTTVGTLSTLSHGFFLIISGPVWLSAGIPTSIVHGRTIRVKVTPRQYREMLYQFARYPQGPPPTVWPFTAPAEKPSPPSATPTGERGSSREESPSSVP